MTSQSVVFIGGPNAGKSNYLFRLWLAIRSGKNALQKRGMPTDLDYLNTGAAALLAGRFADRTPTGAFNTTEIPIQWSSPDDVTNQGTIVVPDASGEECVQIFREREWSENWEEQVAKLPAWLLFLRHDAKDDPLDWVQCQMLFSKQGTDGVPEIVKNVKSDENVVPTQTVAVEWLQFIRDAMSDRGRRAIVPRVGLILSAWDTIPGEYAQEGPQKLLQREYPLLGHFLMANDQNYRVEYFGTSIVGGDLDDIGFRDTFLNLTDPSTSGYIVMSKEGHLEKVDDLTLPIKWALSSD
jgi:hypothetical protein